MNDVLVPSKSVIDGWYSLQNQPIVETVPRASPRSAYLRYPADQAETRRLALKTGFPAVENIQKIMTLNEHTEKVYEYLVNIYAERGISRIIQQDYLEPLKKEHDGEMPDEWKTEEARNIATQILTPKVDYLDTMITSVQDYAKTVADLFMDKDLWAHGKYSDELLTSLAKLLFNMTCLEQLAPVKPSLNDDVSFLKKQSVMGGQTGGFDPAIGMKLMTIQQWVANSRAARMYILKLLEKISYAQMMAVFNIVYPFAKGKIESSLFFAADKFIYINLLIFIVSLHHQQMGLELQALKQEKLTQYRREAEKKSTKGKTVKPKELTQEKIKELKKKMNYKPLSMEVRFFLKEVAEKYRIMPLFLEVASETTYNLPPNIIQLNDADVKKIDAPRLKVPDFEILLKESRKHFSKLSYCVSKMLTVAEDRVIPSYANMLIDVLPKVITHFSLVLSHIRQAHVENIIRPPPADPDNEEQKNWSAYERSMNIGMSDSTDNGKVARFLLLLCISRSAKELIQTHLPRIFAHISYYVAQYMQDFAWNQLPQVITKNAGSKTGCVKILERLRTLLGCFNASEYKIDPKKLGKMSVPALSAAPHRDMIELARVQVQMLINPGSENMKMAGVKTLQKFLDDTVNFDALLRLDEAINDAFDQSVLYFRETCLAVSGKSFFPVSTSLPMVLSNFAMYHYQNPELTNAIFYPLSIYDDAASMALRVFKAKFMYDEIKAEANICVVSIMKLIADSAYLPIRRFSLLRLISRKMSEAIIPKLPGENPDAPFQESITVVRIGVILQQNQLEVLGCPVDVRVLIAARLNELMSEEIQKVAGLISKDGLLVTVAVNKLMEVLKNTNAVFAGFGLPMMSFDDQFSMVMGTDSPNTLLSGVLANCASHLIETVVNDYYLITGPLRLIPSIPPKIDYEGLFTGNAANVGQIASLMVSPTSEFISVENFRELFWLINDGSIKVMHNYVLGLIPELFEQFLTCYKSIGGRLKRIRDAPIGSATVQVFDMFEGAYRFFSKDPNMVALFRSMRALGNIIGICEMMDNAFALKLAATQQVGAFLLGQNPRSGKEGEVELFDIFDVKFKKIREMMTKTYKIPGEDELLQPFLCEALEILVPLIIQNQDVFNETSPNLLDITTSTSFATKWGIIEFLFTLMESKRQVKTEDEEEEDEDEDKIDLGSLGTYGEAMLIIAGIIICSMDQKPLYKMSAIGNRIKKHQMIAFDGAKEPRVRQFLAVNEMVSASMSTFLAAYQTAIYRIVKH